MGGVLSQQPQQSLQTPPISSQPKAEGFLAKHQTYLSYFIPMSTPTLTHTHTRPSGPASINAVISILTSKGLPPELVQRIMEDARYWSKCVRSNKKACTIVAGMEPPRQQRGGQLERWVSGQEEEMMGEMTMTNSGLKDDCGKVWYLCSGPIGCSPTRPKVLEEKAIRLDEAESEERAAQVWLRQVVVETSSKDQGWTDHMQYYGKSPLSRSNICLISAWLMQEGHMTTRTPGSSYL